MVRNALLYFIHELVEACGRVDPDGLPKVERMVEGALLDFVHHAGVVVAKCVGGHVALHVEYEVAVCVCNVVPDGSFVVHVEFD